MVIYDPELQAQFNSLISCLPNTYYTDGLCPSPKLFIVDHVHNRKHIEFPINNESLQQIQSLSGKSMFGYKTSTKYDTNVRSSCELENNRFELDNFQLDSRQSVFLEQIRKKLMHHVDFIIAKPYKLLIYKQGCFFRTHKDSKMSPLHFGSLVIMLPYHALHEGGDFILTKNKNTKHVWKHNKKQLQNQCQYISFYTDTDHEICAITKGVRITVTFQLLINEKYYNDFNKYNHIILNNSYHEHRYQTSKKPRNKIKTNKKGLQKIKKIRGMNLNPKYAVYDIKLYQVLISICDELHLLTPDICKIIAQFSSQNVMELIKKHTIEKDTSYEYKLKHVNYTFDAKTKEYVRSYNCRVRLDLTNVAFFVMFEHKYSGNTIHPCMLKGRDIYVYKYFQKYMFVYATPLRYVYIVGTQSYGYDDSGVRNLNGETWEIKEEWNHNHKRCTANVEIGHSYGQKPEFINDGDYIPKYVIFMQDKQETLQYIGHKSEDEMHHYIGNGGTYSLHDCYHCCGLYMTPFFPCKSTDILTKFIWPTC